MNIIKIFYLILAVAKNHIFCRASPIFFAKKIGVNIGEKCNLFSIHPGTFGSEPYLVTIGDNVTITAGVKFITHDGSVYLFRDKYPKMDIIKPISVGKNTFIGSHSIILPGVSIGENCVIGAMSLVSKSIPNNSVAVGNPAKVIMSTDELLEKHKANSMETGELDASHKEKILKKIKATTEYNYEIKKWIHKE